METKRLAFRKIEELFGIDFRALAVFRMSIALAIISDLVVRAADLAAHYSDVGLLPRDALGLLGYPSSQWWFFPIHSLSGNPFVVGMIFIVAGLLALALLVGYQTKVATVASWILLISLQTRNPLILQGSDVLLRLLLFWGMFIPWGATYSLDSFYASSSQKGLRPVRVFSAGTVALLLQIVFVYLFAVAVKLQPGNWLEGEAVYYALNVDAFVRPFGIFLRGFPDILPFLTYTVLTLQLVGVFLLFSPFLLGPLRTATVFMFWLMHASLGFSLTLGPFPWIASIAMIPFLPSAFWDKVMPPSHTFFSHPPPLNSSWVGNTLAAFFLVYILFWNLGAFYQTKDRVKWIGFLFRLDQEWAMFAPYTLRDDGWYVIPGTLANGTQIDLWRGEEPVTWGKPLLVSTLYKNQHWRKYGENIFAQRFGQFRVYFAQYLCYNWNTQHTSEKQLTELEIFYMHEETLPDYRAPEIKKTSLLRHDC